MSNWLGFRDSDWRHVGNCIVRLYGPGTAEDFVANGPQWSWRPCELYSWGYPALINVESPGLDICLRLLDVTGWNDEYAGLPPHTFFLDVCTYELYDDFHYKLDTMNMNMF